MTHGKMIVMSRLLVFAVLLTFVGCAVPPATNQQVYDAQTKSARERAKNVSDLLKQVQGNRAAEAAALAEEIDVLREELFQTNRDLKTATANLFGDSEAWNSSGLNYEYIPVNDSQTYRRKSFQDQLDDQVASATQYYAEERDEQLEIIADPDSYQGSYTVTTAMEDVNNAYSSLEGSIENLRNPDNQNTHLKLTDAELARMDDLLAEGQQIRDDAVAFRNEHSGAGNYDEDVRNPLVAFAARLRLVKLEVSKIRNDADTRYLQMHYEREAEREAELVAERNELTEKLHSLFEQLNDKLEVAFDLLKSEGMIETVSQGNPDDPDIPNFPETAPGWNSTFWDFSSP